MAFVLLWLLLLLLESQISFPWSVISFLCVFVSTVVIRRYLDYSNMTADARFSRAVSVAGADYADHHHRKQQVSQCLHGLRTL